jgi:hypothetical protein
MDIKRAIADRQRLVELFAVANFAGLVGDIFLAHSENHFRHGAEYIPLVFSVAATDALADVIFHLDSRFLYERTIQSFTYAAPFAAPLAYTGLGLLLIANRLLDPNAREWSEWILLLALGGFVGNFVFSLTDHPQNGFFHSAEWIPVVASACAIGCLIVPFLVDVPPAYVRLSVAVLAGEALVGLLGFGLHALADLGQSTPTVFEKILRGAPPMAPLLFVNLSILAAIALAARLTPNR